MDLLLMTDHLRKLSAEPRGAHRRNFAGTGLAILGFALLGFTLASILHDGDGQLSRVTATPTTEDAR